MHVSNESHLDVGHALERVITWLREARDPEGLSASSLSALSRLATSGPLRITELAEREGLSQPGMTTLANRLEEAGLALREADPTDGRAVRLAVTAAGTERVTRYREARASLIALRIGELDTADQQALASALPAFEHFAAQSEKLVEPRKLL
jgi:DNA-binding MarR family transcriptional regulator